MAELLAAVKWSREEVMMLKRVRLIVSKKKIFGSCVAKAQS